MHRRCLLGGLGAGAAAGLLGGCDAPGRLASLPARLHGQASFHGMPVGTRIVLDGSDEVLLGRVASEALDRELAWAMREGRSDVGPANFLAISGGGANGAYGAGLLVAWSERGTRPEFKVVTGVSTGALTAPFAFLGEQYDRQLEHFYTGISTADIMVSRGLLIGLTSDSFYDSTPLLQTIRGVLTPEFVAAIAREYSDKGRLLIVATTNLDIPAGVLWNMGSIAASSHPRRAELMARILLASASIPGVFPPVMIDLEAGGERFQEMNVDGGTVAQVVLYPPSISRPGRLSDIHRDARRRQAFLDRKRSLYVIRNSRPGGDFETVDRRTLKIVERAVATLISTQGLGDLYQLYLLAHRDGIDYNVTYIPQSFSRKLREPFDQEYMKNLFQVGREAMLKGAPWHKYPPGYDPVPITRQTPA
ncbi:patatin-like phospholipase family protein [Reyranella sp.]|uniref:patatin-like phospholipase family protein n=1 Tax=Reyranella sp. TaxID=1929291 RepID=UPI0025EC6415|nr:patatin-like phospholipase family protein [Reyranella sp.]